MATGGPAAIDRRRFSTRRGGLTIGLNAREQASPSSGGGAVITFQPDGSIDEELARLREQGVRFTGEISEHSWGRIAPFRDSEGNDLHFCSPPQD